MNNEASIFSFYMHEVAVRPLDFLITVKSKSNPTYWEEYWAYYAALRMEDYDFVEKIYAKYIEEEDEGNDFYVLLAYEAYLDHLENPEDEECVPTGYELLMRTKNRISPLLNEAFEAMHSLLPVEDDVLQVEENFYTQQLFVPRQFLSISSVRDHMNQTKTQEEWKREINFLCDRLEFFRVDCMLHIPDGWEGMTHLGMAPFEIAGPHQPITCYGMWKNGAYDYSLCLDESAKAPQTLPLQCVRDMESYRKIAGLLLQAIDDALEVPEGWTWSN